MNNTKFEMQLHSKNITPISKSSLKTEKINDILRFSHVCPSTEYCVQNLKMKKAEHFDEIKMLTDELLYIEYMLCYENKNVIYDKKDHVKHISNRLQSLLRNYELPDKSYPFRHKIIIENKYDEIESNFTTKIGRFFNNNIIPKFVK